MSDLSKSRVIVRKFTHDDSKEVERIAADTAFFGKPVEAFLEDRHLFIDAFIRFYTEYLPAYIWVGEYAGQTVGYICGSPHPGAGKNEASLRIHLEMIRNLILGKYRIGTLTWRYAMRGLWSVLRGQNPAADYRQYPAHLHINLDENFRGLGIGRMLLEVFIAEMKAEGVSGIQLHTTAENLAACHLYEKMGFRLLKKNQNLLWVPFLGRPVETRCYGLQLNR